MLEELAGIATEYPDDAKLCRLLMIALHRDGHPEEITPVIDATKRRAPGPTGSSAGSRTRW